MLQDVLGILVELNAMEAQTLRLLPLGLVARSINCNNELWMAAALSHPGVMDLTPPQLAAFVGALQCTDLLKRPMSIWSSYQVGQGYACCGWQKLLRLCRLAVDSSHALRTGMSPPSANTRRTRCCDLLAKSS